MSRALAQIRPAQRIVRLRDAPPPSEPAAPPPRTGLSGREKAAIIVRLLLAEGSPLPLSALPDQMQSALAEQIGQMRLVDRTTLSAVVQEFLGELEQVGLSFPGGLEGALSMMDGHISPSAATRLRRLAGSRAGADPWDRLVALPADQLLPLLDGESAEVAAVVLSRLPVAKAADLLGQMAGDRARRVAYAVSMTGNVDPDTVRRIGLALTTLIDSQPARAFADGPVARVGAILNVSPAATRDDVLRGLEEADRNFADQVRRAIFTFAHIPRRVQPRDVAKIIRVLDPRQLVVALATSQARPDQAMAAEFILTNLSQRMAQGLREEMGDLGRIKDKDGEEAMNAVVLAVRQLEGAGEITLIEEEE